MRATAASSGASASRATCADVFAMQVELARKVVQSVAPFVRSLELQARAHHQLRAARRVCHHAARRRADAPPVAARISCRRAPPSRPRSRATRCRRGRTPGSRSGTCCASRSAPATNAAQDSAAATACAERALACDADDALALAVDAHGRGAGRGTISTRPSSAWRRRWPPIRTSRSPGCGAAITHAWRGRGAEAVQCADRALSLSPLDPMIYYFNSLAGMANLIGERYERAIELSTRSLRENRLHTPTLRTLAAALVLSGRSGRGARDDGPAARARAGADRYARCARVIPGATARRPARFIGALLDGRAAGVAARSAPIETPAEIATNAAISAAEGTSPRNTSARTAVSTGTSATSALERSAPSRAMAWFSAMSATQPISTPCQRTCQSELERRDAPQRRGRRPEVPRHHDQRRIERHDRRALDRADAPVAQLQHVERAERGRGEEHGVAGEHAGVSLGSAPPGERQHADRAQRCANDHARAKGAWRRPRIRAARPRPGSRPGRARRRGWPARAAGRRSPARPCPRPGTA